MIIPTFTVFDTFISSEVITKIENQGHVCVYNNCEKDRIYHLFPNEQTFKVFYINKIGLIQVSMMNSSEYKNMYSTPNFAISFEEPVSKDMWECIRIWCTVVFYGNNNDIENSFETANKFMVKPSIQKQENVLQGTPRVVDGLKSTVISMAPSKIDLKEGYFFQKMYDEGSDIMYYEVIAPSSELPFTVVVVNYSQKDDSWFFSDIYGCYSWDSNRMGCRHDYQFLVFLWKALKLPGEFTFEVVKKRVDGCYPSRCLPGILAQAEPIVYRKSLSQVVGNTKRAVVVEEEGSNKIQKH